MYFYLLMYSMFLLATVVYIGKLFRYGCLERALHFRLRFTEIGLKLKNNLSHSNLRLK